MQREVLKCIDNMERKDTSMLLMGDFNCKKISWEEMEVNGEAGQWSEMLQLALTDTMAQWVEESTRYRGEEEPSMLNLLVFTKNRSPDQP